MPIYSRKKKKYYITYTTPILCCTDYLFFIYAVMKMLTVSENKSLKGINEVIQINDNINLCKLLFTTYIFYST